jgi:hypothetical protein
MVQCWCHAAMSGWLGVATPDLQIASQARLRRWQHECARAGSDCASRVEAIALRLPHARAIRTGPLLRLYTEAGPVEFIDGREGPASDHRYLGLLETGLRHLVWRRGPEGVRFLTVNERCGTQAVFDSLAQALTLMPPPQASASMQGALSA